MAGVARMALGWLWWRAWVGAVVAAAVCVAGVALGDMDLHFAWQAWHLATSKCILRFMHVEATCKQGGGQARGAKKPEIRLV